jgi:DNA-binding beta-propeller fold protein YncE
VTVLLAAAALLLAPFQSLPLPRATGIDVAPSGHLVVARSGVGSLGTLTVYRRARDGRLTKVQCVTRGAKGCLAGRGLETPSSIAIPRDETNLYVTAANGRSVGIYRIARGRLTLAGSVAGLAHPLTAAVSPAGDTVYVGGDRIWEFERGRGGGLILRRTIAAPARALAVSGDVLYAAAAGKLTAYARADLSETASVAAPRQPSQLVLAHGSLYLASVGSVVRFGPDLTKLGSSGAVPLAFGVAVGDRVYVAYRDGVAAFSLALKPLGSRRLSHATGVAAWGGSVYAVSRDGVTALSR